MPRVYELPTHLQVEDQLIAGLTARQLVRLMIGASLAYGAWDQATWVPQEVRLPLATLLAVLGVLFAVLRPADRPLDQWLLAAVLFVLLLRRLVWRPGATLLPQPAHGPGDWAELDLDPHWLNPEPDRQPDASRPLPHPRRGWWSVAGLRARLSATGKQHCQPRWHA